MGALTVQFSILMMLIGISYSSGCKCFPTDIIAGKTLVSTVFDNIDNSVRDWTGQTNPFTNAPNNAQISNNLNCYVVIDSTDPSNYNLISAEETSAPAGGILTHYGPCGHCSSLQDLQVYLDYANDPNKSLRSDVQACALLETLLGWTMLPFAQAETCVMALGFSEKCSDIWAYNSQASSQKCFHDCFFPNYNLGDTPANEPEPEGLVAKWLFYSWPFNYNPCNPNKCPRTINGQAACTIGSYTKDTRLNECLQCDECNQGPTFKKFAGRTRRNSGIEDEIIRDSSEISKFCYQPSCP